MSHFPPAAEKFFLRYYERSIRPKRPRGKRLTKDLKELVKLRMITLATAEEIMSRAYTDSARK